MAGWSHGVVRVCASCFGSFCLLFQGVNDLANQGEVDGSQPPRQDRPSANNRQQSKLRQQPKQGGLKQGGLSNTFLTSRPVCIGPKKGLIPFLSGTWSTFSQQCAPSNRSTPLLLYTAGKKVQMQGFFLAAGAVAASASLSLAFPFSAQNAELPTAGKGGDNADSGDREMQDSESFYIHDFIQPGPPQSLFLEEEKGERQLSAACLASLGLKYKEQQAIVEPKTKVQFPVVLYPAAAGPEEGSDPSDLSSSSPESFPQVLAGVGVRNKSIVRVKTINIYAFGVYVRPGRLRAELGDKYAGVPPEELKLREDFYDTMLSRELDMTVRLVVHYRGLSMEMIAGNSDDPGLKTFGHYFSQTIDLSRGTVIDFRWQPGGRLQTEIGGKKMETIVSPHLCRAFFDLYIGDPPVSVSAKQDIGLAVARMLSAC
eukprot:jgi/Mesen1/3472/ME000195S02616